MAWQDQRSYAENSFEISASKNYYPIRVITKETIVQLVLYTAAAIMFTNKIEINLVAVFGEIGPV